MDVTIQERRFSLRAEYEITAPNREFFARKKLLALLSRVEVSQPNGSRIATLQGRFSFFRSRYDFQFADGRAYRFGCLKIWKQVYGCERAGESYRLIQHRGVRLSIFLNDRQIAAVERNRLIVGKGYRYQIRMNHDADVEVVASMILAVNVSEGDDNNNSSVTYDFGSLGPEDRRFDESWTPT